MTISPRCKRKKTFKLQLIYLLEPNTSIQKQQIYRINMDTNCQMHTDSHVGKSKKEGGKIDVQSFYR